MYRTVYLETKDIVDEATFHGAFKKEFGFPEWHGANMDAWIETMSEALYDPGNAQTTLKLDPDEILTIEVNDTEDFAKRLPELFTEFVVCTSFINQHYIKGSGKPAIHLLFK